MKIYLCKKCNKTIPLDQLSTHLEQCGPEAEIALKTGWKAKTGGVFKVIFLIIAGIVLTGGGILLGSFSFKSIASMRQLERIPETVVIAALPGEVNLNGRALKLDRDLRGPKSDAPCFYYRYLVEKEERDSDGDTTWRTLEDRTERTDFILKDNTGQITMRAGGPIDFSLPKSFSTQIGDHRYSEWRIDPNDQLFVFGYVKWNGSAYEVRFDVNGYYDPIVSKYDETRERLWMAGKSILMCWGGLVCLAFALAFLIQVFRIHRLLVYFNILGMIIVLYLCILGVKMMRTDLKAAVDRLTRHENTARALIQRRLKGAGVKWNGKWKDLKEFSTYRSPKFPGKQVSRLERIRLDLAVATRRVQLQRNAFPERLLAPGWKIPKKHDLALPKSQQKELAKRESGFEKAKVPPVLGWSVCGGAFLVGALAFFFGFRRVRFKRCMENLPTSKTAGAAYGLTELKGFVDLPDGEEPLQGPVSFRPCIQYHYIVKERRRSGKKTTWVTIIDENHRRPFLCEDTEGTMWIDPDGAEIMTQHRSSRREGRYHYHETRLELADPLYAIGECVIEEVEGDSLYMKKPMGSYPFVLSNMTEDTVMRKVAALGIILLNVSFAALLLLALTFFGLSGSFAATDYLASALVAPIFMTLVTLILHFNDLIFLRERANRNWSNIDVSLKKRHDLIPVLEKIVKAYMAHESGVMESVTRLRGAYQGAEQRDHAGIAQYMESEHTALSQLLAVYEDYPNLKADQNAGLLMRKLIVLENEVALMRNGFNNAVETYNTRIQSFPDLIFAKMFHFKDKTFLQAETAVIEVPPSLQSMWQRDRIATGTPAEAVAAAGTAAAVPTPDRAPIPLPSRKASAAAEEDKGEAAIEARAMIYALLLDGEEALRKAQLSVLSEHDCPEVSQKTESLLPAVTAIQDEVQKLKTADGQMEALKALSPSTYRTLKLMVRELIEADDTITLFEYALQKSLTRQLDAAFGQATPRPERYHDLILLAKPVSLVISRLAQAEEKPDDTAQDAFSQGVSLLNHEPKTDFTFLPIDQCNLGSFDAAVEDLACCVPMIKANLFFACTKAVELNDDYTFDQALLLAAVADTFSIDRPSWL